jgi:photosystem II stability/assembly factor-like uncharacterized protein
LNRFVYLKPKWVMALVACCAFWPATLHAVTWFPLGPYGGDARSFAADPGDSKHLYLGTANGWIYESRNGGSTWTRLCQLGGRNDLVIDHIVPDAKSPNRLVAAAFVADHPDGGVYLSQDGGKTWHAVPQMLGQSVLSLARAPSQPSTVIAGTLKGVYRSLDNGEHWIQISPENSTEIHEVESLAIDPANPEVIYAGTWHLPWKTTDGGAHWENIKKGIIEDSDVFSILIDPQQPRTVYASACSGIYKSTDAAALFAKVQGIPSEARRTRKLEMDPEHPDTVYAGTTEGLYRTLDAGHTWGRLTSSDLIINDVYVDPHDSGHIILATDRAGVLRSEDFGASFQPSNTGFSARQVVAYSADPNHPALVHVGVVNDKDNGGVFQSTDGGAHWQQQSSGLGGRDVYSLETLPDGTLLAGTTHGVFRLQDDLWVNSGALVKASSRGKKAAAAAPSIDGVVYALVPGDGYSTYAGTSDGLLRSDNDGVTWSEVSALTNGEIQFVAVQKNVLLAAGLKNLDLSVDGGRKWGRIALPPELTQISAVAVDGEECLWVGGREGVYYSQDNGVSWKQLHDLEIPQVDGMYFDPIGKRMLFTTSRSTMIFAVSVPGHRISYWDTGWKLRLARPMGDHLLGATLYDGMVIQPKMVDSGFAPDRVAVIDKSDAASVPSHSSAANRR